MNDNPYGFTDEEFEALQRIEWSLTGAGVSFEDACIAIANFANISPLVDDFAWTLSDPFFDAAPDPDPKQIAYARSKRDRRRKARGGRYKWGGQADE